MQPNNDIVATAATAPDRRHRRRSVLWPVEIVSKPGIRCTITDISIAGAKMLVNKPLAEGESLIIRSRRFTARVTIAWVGAGTVGLEFHEPNERLERALDAP
jgi:hypothetical protein